MKLLRLAWIGSFVFAALVYLAVWIVAGTAVKAWEITPHDNETVEVNQGMFEMDAPDPDDPEYPRMVMEIYGNPATAPNDWLFVAEDRLFHPNELPSLTLLPVDRNAGEDPLQVVTVRFLARWAFACSAGFGFVLFALWFWRKRKRQKTT